VEDHYGNPWRLQSVQEGRIKRSLGEKGTLLEIGKGEAREGYGVVGKGVGR